MLHAHRRALMRLATGPSSGEIRAGQMNVIVGAFSDAQMFEDPWQDNDGAGAEWEPASLSRASSGTRPPYRGEAIPYMIGDLSLQPTWSLPEVGNWEPRGIGDFRTSMIYGRARAIHKSPQRYQGEALPFMVGDLALGPEWSKPEVGQWEPRGLGDFRTSMIYGHRPGSDAGSYYGDAIPTMVGDLDDEDDDDDIGGVKGRARRKARRLARAEKVREKTDIKEAKAERGETKGRGKSRREQRREDRESSEGMLVIGSLPSGPVWSLPETGEWEPHGLGDFRNSEVYGEGGHYRGDAIPTMVGAVSVRHGKVQKMLSARKVAEGRHARAVYRAIKDFQQWANKERIPVVKAMGGASPDGATEARGVVLALPSANDRIQASTKAKAISVTHRTFYNMVPMGGGNTLVYFTDDPAAFLVQASATGGQDYLQYVAAVAGLFDRSPEKQKATLEKLEERLQALQAGDKPKGPFGAFTSEKGLLKRINKLREKLGMAEYGKDSDEASGYEDDDEDDNVEDETGRLASRSRLGGGRAGIGRRIRLGGGGRRRQGLPGSLRGSSGSSAQAGRGGRGGMGGSSSSDMGSSSFGGEGGGGGESYPSEPSGYYPTEAPSYGPPPPQIIYQDAPAPPPPQVIVIRRGDGGYAPQGYPQDYAYGLDDSEDD